MLYDPVKTFILLCRGRFSGNLPINKSPSRRAREKLFSVEDYKARRKSVYELAHATVDIYPCDA